MATLITKSELADLANVSRAAVSAAIKTGRIDHAIRGNKIDAGDPEIADFIARAERKRKGGKRPGPKKGEPPSSRRKIRKNLWNPDITEPATPPPAKVAPSPDDVPERVAPLDKDNLLVLADHEVEYWVSRLPPDLRSLVDYPLKKLIEMYGSASYMIDWLKAVEKLDKIHKTRLENAEKEGRLVARQLVIDGVIAPLNAEHKKLMTDGARSIAKRVSVMALSGKPTEECEIFVRDRIATYLKSAKEIISRVLSID